MGEFQVGGNAVLANADDNDVLLLEGTIVLRKGAGLAGAARGIVLGVEVQHHLLAQKRGQADGVAVLIVECKIRGFCSNFKHDDFSFYLALEPLYRRWM